MVGVATNMSCFREAETFLFSFSQACKALSLLVFRNCNRSFPPDAAALLSLG